MRLYWKFFSIHLKSEMAYPASFFLSCAGRLLLTINALAGIGLMIWRFGAIGDYTAGEVLLGFGVVMTAFNIAECFARGFDVFSKIVREGTFDRLVVRPRGLVFQVICQDMRMASLPNIVLGSLVILYGARASGIAWTVPKALVLLSMVACGSLLFFGVFLVYAALCFFTMEGLEFINIFTDGIRTFSQFPFDIYGKGVLFFTTAVMPMAMVQYWPLQYLMGKGRAIYGMFPVLSLWFLIPCWLAWRLGIRHYASAGS